MNVFSYLKKNIFEFWIFEGYIFCFRPQTSRPHRNNRTSQRTGRHWSTRRTGMSSSGSQKRLEKDTIDSFKLQCRNTQCRQTTWQTHWFLSLLQEFWFSKSNFTTDSMETTLAPRSRADYTRTGLRLRRFSESTHCNPKHTSNRKSPYFHIYPRTPHPIHRPYHHNPSKSLRIHCHIAGHGCIEKIFVEFELRKALVWC